MVVDWVVAGWELPSVQVGKGMLDIADLLKAGYYESDVDIPIKEENEMAKVHVAMWCAAPSAPRLPVRRLHRCRYTIACLKSGGMSGGAGWNVSVTRSSRVMDRPRCSTKLLWGPTAASGCAQRQCSHRRWN